LPLFPSGSCLHPSNGESLRGWSTRVRNLGVAKEGTWKVPRPDFRWTHFWLGKLSMSTALVISLVTWLTWVAIISVDADPPARPNPHSLRLGVTTNPVLCFFARITGSLRPLLGVFALPSFPSPPHRHDPSLMPLAEQSSHL